MLKDIKSGKDLIVLSNIQNVIHLKMKEDCRYKYKENYILR